MSSNTSYAHWEAEILEQLDEYAAAYDFPMPDNAYFYNADLRLKVFRSAQEWLIIFEEIALSNQRSFVNSVFAYGNRVAQPGTQRIVDVVTGGPDGELWDGAGRFLLDRWQFTVTAGGQPRSFSPSARDYEEAGVDPHSGAAALDILRLLAYRIPDELFLPDRELLRMCDRADAGLERFLQLADWHHPDLADDELPGQLSCFRHLARATARGDVGLYVCPPESWNTHWSNWEHEADWLAAQHPEG
jgi:hypothetical protein